jgi:WD40 repeat protein
MTFDSVPADGKVAAVRLSADGRIVAIAWSPDARWANPGENGVPTAVTVEAFRLPERERLFSMRLPNLDSLELSPAGDLMAIFIPGHNQAPPIRTFELYATGDGTLVWSSSDVIPPFVFSPDGARLLGNVGSSGSLGCWTAATGEAVYTTPIDEAPGAYYTSLAVSRDGQRVIGSASLDTVPPARDVFARFTYRRAGDGQLDRMFAQVSWFDQAWAIVTSPDGDRWAAVTQNIQAGLTPVIQVRDSAGTVLYTLPTSFDGLAAFSPDGENLITTNGAGVGLHRASDGWVIASRSFR